jgi:lysozyme
VAEGVVSRAVRVALTQGQFDALVDFTYNLGGGRLAASTLLRDLNAGQYDAAAEQLLVWDMAAGVVNLGLKSRREAEFNLWTGRAFAPAKPTIGPPLPPHIKAASTTAAK